jgi:hypothetical protein
MIVCVVLFHMFFRSTDILYPWRDWLKAYKINRMPRPLPTRAELAAIREQADGSCEPVLQEFMACGASLIPYWDPRPSAETHPLLTTNSDWIRYGLGWTASRLQWCECILSIDQEWPMFSPGVPRRRWPVRARLLFADGTETTVRQRSDPEDLTCYLRWDQGKNLGYDRFVSCDHIMRRHACPGWCNFLAHRHPVSFNGSPLREIRLYHVTYHFVPPNEDPVAFLNRQMERNRDHHSPGAWDTFFVYHVETPPRWEFVSQGEKVIGRPLQR